MAILGRSIREGKEYLEIDYPNDQELKKVGVYLSTSLDQPEISVGLYVDSRTGLEGVYPTTEDYDKTRKTGKVYKKDAGSARTKMTLTLGYTWHIRPVFIADQAAIPRAKVMALDHTSTDLCNTMYTGHPSVLHYHHRRAKIIKAQKEATPVDIRDVP